MRHLFVIAAVIVSTGTVLGQERDAIGTADYFPLGAADSWTYGFVVAPPDGPPETYSLGPVSVRGEVSVHDTTYVLLTIPSLFTDTLRTDAEGRVWGRIDGRDRLILDLTLADGATYSFEDPGAESCPSVGACTSTVTVRRGLTVETLAGRFEDAVSFSFDNPQMMDDELLIALAPGVGVVRTSTYLQPFDLIEATVGGRHVTPVEVGPEPVSVRAFPNPFTSRVTVELPPGEWAHVEVFDTLGRRVVTLLDGPCAPTACRLEWDGSDAAPGVYLVRATGPTATTAYPVVRAR